MVIVPYGRHAFVIRDLRIRQDHAASSIFFSNLALAPLQPPPFINARCHHSIGSSTVPETMVAHLCERVSHIPPAACLEDRGIKEETNPINRQCFSMRRDSAIFSPISVHAGWVSDILAASPLTPMTFAPVATDPMLTIRTSFFASRARISNFSFSVFGRYTHGGPGVGRGEGGKGEGGEVVLRNAPSLAIFCCLPSAVLTPRRRRRRKKLISTST